MSDTTIYTATDQERALATDWHGGQASALYAVASTGALSRGTCRPRWWGGEPMSDAEWSRDLVGRLRSELQDIAPDPADDDADHDRAVRDAWAHKLQALARELEEEVDSFDRWLTALRREQN